MATKHDLGDWIVEALRAPAARRASSRSAATSGSTTRTSCAERRPLLHVAVRHPLGRDELRHAGVLKPANLSPTGVWELARP